MAATIFMSARWTARWSGRRAATKGFGFDPVFMPDGFDITFGEMPVSAKHSWAPGQVGLSHRARAFAKFVEGAIELS